MKCVKGILLFLMMTVVLAGIGAAEENVCRIVHSDGSWEIYEDGSALPENRLSLGYICETGQDMSYAIETEAALPPMIPTSDELAGNWEGEGLSFHVDASGMNVVLETGEAGRVDQGKMTVGERIFFLQKSIWPLEDFLPEERKGMAVFSDHGTEYLFYGSVLYVYEFEKGEGVRRLLLWKTEGSGV